MSEVEVNGRTWKIKQNLIDSSQSIPVLRDNIYKWLGRLGIEKDYVALEHGPYPRDKWAEVKWQVNGDDFSYRCTSQINNKNCLAAIEQLVHQEVIFIERGIKTFGQVMNQFRLGYSEDGEKIRSPHEILGISSNNKDMDYIEFRYKSLAKILHPDTETGDADKFKELNDAFEELKKNYGGKNDESGK